VAVYNIYLMLYMSEFYYTFFILNMSEAKGDSGLFSIGDLIICPMLQYSDGNDDSM